MFEYTENNHFKFGYVEHGWFIDRKSKDDTFIIEHGKCSYEPGSWKDECLIAAQKIYESTDLPINIMFSGGIDSEIVVQSFMQINIPFNISILQFKNNLNIHDISFAIVFCEQHNIKYDLIKLDIVKFWENDAYTYAERSNSWSPETCPTMWLADQIDGLPVMGSGPVGIFKKTPKNYIPGKSSYDSRSWYIQISEMTCSWNKHFINQDRAAVPTFFQYTPEMMYSFLLDPIMIDLINNKIPGKLSNASSKYKIYTRYFDLLYRKKCTGYDRMQKPDNYKTLEDYSTFFKIEYNKLLEDIKYV